MNKIKEVTMYDIAGKLNISVATVSWGLQDDKLVSKKTRRKIADLAEPMIIHNEMTDELMPETT